MCSSLLGLGGTYVQQCFVCFSPQYLCATFSCIFKSNSICLLLSYMSYQHHAGLQPANLVTGICFSGTGTGRNLPTPLPTSRVHTAGFAPAHRSLWTPSHHQTGSTIICVEHTRYHILNPPEPAATVWGGNNHHLQPNQLF